MRPYLCMMILPSDRTTNLTGEKRFLTQVGSSRDTHAKK